METLNKKAIDTMVMYSNTILAFVVLQSIAFAYQLANKDFTAQIQQTPFIIVYLLLGQIIIINGSVIAMLYYSRKIKTIVTKEINGIINSRIILIVKIGLVFYFGIIPIIILLIRLIVPIASKTN